MRKSYDFSGWATKNDLLCSDGRTIRKDAFKDSDGKTVPLVWNHQHNEAANVLGHALLENRDEGVYAYCTFNNTETGQNAKLLVQNGDIRSLSIYANRLKQQGSNVLHGAIREVSLVLAGANPGATIDSVLVHGEDGEDDEAVIYTGLNIEFYHAEEESVTEKKEDEKETEMANKERTVQDVFDEMTEEQKTVVYAMVGAALEEAGIEDEEDDEEMEDDEEEEEMKHNVFDYEERQDDVLCHANLEAVFADARRLGRLSDAVDAHELFDAVDNHLAHGITNIGELFPDAKNYTSVPTWIKRKDDWVGIVMNGVHKTPFSRIKSLFADITADAARARGYIKGNLKVEEVFSLLKRTTTPQTVYKKQKLDRDDVIDIVDFDVVAWIKREMRMMLDEEIARAILIGDGRLASDDDKISEEHIRPIWTDSPDLFVVSGVVEVTAADSDSKKAKAFIKEAIKARKNYKGSGSPVLFTTEDVLTDCLLIEDKNERVIYDTVDKLATALRVSKIVPVPVMENQTRTVSNTTRTLLGIIVNLNDYNVGADKGGDVNLFDDFDIDYNAQKYLIETRCSGALVTPFSAIVLEQVTTV